MYFQRDGAPPHSSCQVSNFLNFRFPGRWKGRKDGRSPQLASQVSRFKPTGLLCMGMDEKTGLQCEGGNVRCIAWSHFEGLRPHLNESAKAGKNNERSSQPIGSLFCGRR